MYIRNLLLRHLLERMEYLENKKAGGHIFWFRKYILFILKKRELPFFSFFANIFLTITIFFFPPFTAFFLFPHFLMLFLILDMYPGTDRKFILVSFFPFSLLPFSAFHHIFPLFPHFLTLFLNLKCVSLEKDTYI